MAVKIVETSLRDGHHPSLSLSFRRGAHVPGTETANRRVLLSFLEQVHAAPEPLPQKD